MAVLENAQTEMDLDFTSTGGGANPGWVPAQNPEITTPRCARPADELREDLLSALKQTQALLESNADLDYGEMMIEHPLLGNNNVPGLLRFLAFHEPRHQSQN
jgi:hypothetical protein